MLNPLRHFLWFGYATRDRLPAPDGAPPVQRRHMQETALVSPASAAVGPLGAVPGVDADTMEAATPARQAMPTIAFILVQKNEGGLLKSWFNYHTRLTRPEHIYIIDNGSADPLTASILAEIREAGGKVDESFHSAAAFNKKHEIVLGLIKKLQSQGDFDFIIPLDCDEFLAVMSDDKVPEFRPDRIGAELTKHLGACGPLAMAGSFYNNPCHFGSFFFSREKAVFFASDPVETIDLGYHRAETVSGQPAVPTNVVAMHLQYKRFERAKAQAAEKLKLRVPNFAEATIRSFDGTGSHMNKFFLAGATGYEGKFQSGAPADLDRYAPFMAIMREPDVALPVDLFSSADRYGDYRAGVAEASQTYQAIAEGSSLDEILFISREAAASTKVAFFRDCMLADLLIDTTTADFLILDIRRPAARRPVATRIASGAIRAPRVRIAEFDIGEVDDLGYPSAPGVAPEAYSVESGARLAPDTGLVVVAGRYRASVALACLRHVAPGCRVIVPNFWSRPHYHSVLPFFDVVDTEGDSVLLRAGKVLDRDALDRQIALTSRDPR
jgi:hypothetical protein